MRECERSVLNEVQETRNFVHYTENFIMYAACYLEIPFYANKLFKSCATSPTLSLYFIDENCC